MSAPIIYTAACKFIDKLINKISPKPTTVLNWRPDHKNPNSITTFNERSIHLSELVSKFSIHSTCDTEVGRIFIALIYDTYYY